MRVCRFSTGSDDIRLGVVTDENTVLDLTPTGLTSLTALLESRDPVAAVRVAAHGPLPNHALSNVRLHAPVERQEGWAAGVTYLRSKAARMEESDFSATACLRPAATAATPLTPLTCTGACRSMIVPSPSCPESFAPQAQAEPSDFNAMVCCAFAATAVTPLSRVTGTGVVRWAIVLSPS